MDWVSLIVACTTTALSWFFAVPARDRHFIVSWIGGKKYFGLVVVSLTPYLIAGSIGLWVSTFLGWPDPAMSESWEQGLAGAAIGWAVIMADYKRIPALTKGAEFVSNAKKSIGYEYSRMIQATIKEHVRALDDDLLVNRYVPIIVKSIETTTGRSYTTAKRLRKDLKARTREMKSAEHSSEDPRWDVQNLVHQTVYEDKIERTRFE